MAAFRRVALCECFPSYQGGTLLECISVSPERAFSRGSAC